MALNVEGAFLGYMQEPSSVTVYLKGYTGPSRTFACTHTTTATCVSGVTRVSFVDDSPEASFCQDGQCEVVTCPTTNALAFICAGSPDPSIAEQASAQEARSAPKPTPIPVNCGSLGQFVPSANDGQGGCLYRYVGGFQIMSPPGSYLVAQVQQPSGCQGYEWSNGQSTEAC